MINFQHEDGDDDEGDDDDEGPSKKAADKKSGRRKIKIEFINDKSRRHITFSKRKAGIMKKAYELSTLTGTQVLLLVVSETGLVYTFTTAKLQPLVTQPEGKNLIQACLNAPAGQIPTGAPLGQAGSSVHQANIHNQPQVPQSSGGPVPVTHPASGVAQGMPPPTAMPPPTRNIPGGINIGGNKRDDDMEDDDEEEPASPSDDATSPMVDLGPGGLQRHTSHHGAPGQPRPTAATNHSARGAHHGVHPYGGGARDAGHRRRTSSNTNAASAGGVGGPGRVTSPRLAMQRQASGLSDNNGGLETQSPTTMHYAPHAHDPQAALYYGQQGYPPQQQQPGPPQGAPPGSWGQAPPGVHQHRR
ncbi:hypothetical protein PIIN_00796 [Serendipita indica DSM 11827]|uniref:MADS-box domain-containing protein n=1 Tax=Serendipita indica (strain DSM 11827) TaxID=1109443 RepID=G4T6K9_SERID|nr:hypothetical protein PIIN_00796 [Serendipita indica DSM 11827]